MMLNFGISSCCSEVFKPISEDGDLFNFETGNRLRTLPLEFAGAFWPSKVQLDQKILHDTITTNVLDYTENWIKTVFLPQWIPDNIKENLIGLRIRMPFIPPEDIDYVIIRYEIGGHKIQIMENGIALQILIVPPEADSQGKTMKDYILSAGRKFFRIPEEEMQELTANVKEDTINAPFCHGTISINDKDLVVKKAWWDNIYVFSDSTCVYFGFVEIDGKQKSLQVSPGIPKRF